MDWEEESKDLLSQRNLKKIMKAIKLLEYLQAKTFPQIDGVGKVAQEI